MPSNLHYRPLLKDEFRLMTLLPSTAPPAQLELELFHSSLVDARFPSYIALSYTWDPRIDVNTSDCNEDLVELIIVNGRGVTIQSNLANALRCLRTQSSQCIWADALCIDQSNTMERGSQVLLMRDIFSSAVQVWAWLGQEAKGSNLAMDFLARLAKSSDDQQITDWLGGEALQPPNYHIWEAVRCLLVRPWWKRAWIVQEFAMAQRVTFICGDRRLSAQDFEVADRLLFVHFSAAKNRLVTALKETVAINARTFDPARNLLDLRRRLGCERISALASLQMTRHTLATDPRDHLFAKLGLSGSELAELCPPDYNTGVDDVWFAFLLRYIEQKKDLYIICLAGMQPRMYHHLPSWLPDWGPSKPSYSLCSLSGGDEPAWPHFDAAGGTAVVVSVLSGRLEAGTTLRCKGLQIDTVDGVAGDPWDNEPSFVQQSRFSNNVYKTRSGAFQALCRTLTANTDRTGAWGPPPADFSVLVARRWHELNAAVARYEADGSQTLPFPFYPRASGFERAWRSMRGLHFASEPLRVTVEEGRRADAAVSGSAPGSVGEPLLEPATAPSHPLWTALEHSAGQACFERRLFTTANGFLGIGPATLKPADVLVILRGCRVPVLLRPQQHQYALVGECYVDGIMYGEALSTAGDDGGSLLVEPFELV